MKKLSALGVGAAVVALLGLLPWWAGVGLVVTLGLLAKRLLGAGTGFERFFVGMLEAKSSVLRGATARVHGITPAPEPKSDFDDGFVGLDGLGDLGDLDAMDVDEIDQRTANPIEPTPRVWRYIDVTIELPERDASASDCGTTMWEPGELTIVEPNAVSGKAKDLDGFDDSLGEVHAVDAMQGGDWVALEGDKVFGSQRLRLHISTRPGADAFKLRYYFEVLKNASAGPA